MIRPALASTGGLPSRHGVAWASGLLTLALLPPFAARMAIAGPAVAGLLAAALVAALFWEFAFAALRERAMSLHGVTTALIVAILSPADLPLWQVALSASFGAVIGDLIFGGRGFGFVNGGLLAAGFMAFSFPGTVLAGGSPGVALAVLPGAALLLWAGLANWRCLAGLAIGAGLIALALDAPDPVGLAALLAFPAVYLAADPFGAATTNPGRWLQGGLVGALAVGLAGGAPMMQDAVFAALLGSVFAPLIDAAVLRALTWRRERRHG